MNSTNGSTDSTAIDDNRYGRIAIFIDGSNLYHTIRDLGIHVDYRRLRSYFSRGGRLIRAFYYTAVLEDGTPDWLIRLTDWLSYTGFAVVTKRAKAFRRRQYDENGQVYWRAEI
ncbi:MAG TPA: NYN domain-containing protein, partial [Ardenticatenaceae bacterium]|nr:NYN domain-containing protein [Ardenticatenaceae bacterium]